MQKPVGDKPAFPVTMAEEIEDSGMSLRDYFAAAALTGWATDFEGDDDELANRAFMIADAMLRARERR